MMTNYAGFEEVGQYIDFNGSPIVEKSERQRHAKM
jgi:hypothetical protein